MTEWNAVLLFAVVTLGLGYGVLSGCKSPTNQNLFFRGLETAGVGLSAFSFLGVVLHLLRVPLNWLVYLALACLGPALALSSWLWRRRPPVPARLRRNRVELGYACLLCVVLLAFLKVYYSGAQAYPYLEDEDPWMHAEGVLYVATEHTYKADSLFRPVGHYAFYLEPYPPTFDVLLGILRQVGDSVSFTLKFFNVVMVTLAIAFSFLFASQYLKSLHKGFFVALVLAALPSFMSHFIWSQSLALAVFPVAMYAALRALEDWRWGPPAIVSVASLMVTQPVVSLMAGTVLILLVGCVFLRERALAPDTRVGSFPMTARGLAVGAGGLLLSLLYWGAQLAKWGLSGMLGVKGDEFTTKWQDAYTLRQYTLSQTIFPQPDMIDQPTGWGPVVTVALCVALWSYALRQLKRHEPAKRSFTDLHLLLWFAPLFYLVFAPSFGLPAWGSSRAWGYLAIPVALLATEGVFLVASWSSARSPRLGRPVVVAAALGILATSAPAKLELETSVWAPGQHWLYAPSQSGTTPVGLGGLVKMRELLPRNTRVYAFCGDGDSHTIGFDMASSPWVPSEAAFRERKGEPTLEEALRFLDEHRYAHFTIDASCARDWGSEGAERFLAALGGERRVKALYTDEGFVLAELKP
jgi:hypothetical protein